ncbi:MAG: hypothetical protein HY904_18185 [Deltaproteobacteria bacterium]|nr:hypothetical protein [Deltaproteobacteria bacterium]
MKLASLDDGTPDGSLHVVNRALTRAANATRVARTLQAALDGWDTVGPRLAELAARLEEGAVRDAFPLDVARTLAPLPRAHALLRTDAHGALYPACSDWFLPPHAPPQHAPVLLRGALAAILPHTARGTAASAVHVPLLCLLADVELEKPHGPLDRFPPAAMGPVAVSPDELGSHWQHGRVDLPLVVTHNGEPAITPCPAVAHAALVAAACRRRAVAPGTLLLGPAGEAVRIGLGDTVKVEALAGGHSVFGAVEQGGPP